MTLHFDPKNAVEMSIDDHIKFTVEESIQYAMEVTAPERLAARDTIRVLKVALQYYADGDHMQDELDQGDVARKALEKVITS